MREIIDLRKGELSYNVNGETDNLEKGSHAMAPAEKNNSIKGKLLVVATPIGNLEDITVRALESLKQVGFIACEDTRETRKLLTRYGIKAKTMSYHKFNELSRSEYILELLDKGEDVALVSDAGTPGISDPGYLLVKLVSEKGFDIIPIPGPSALTTMLSVSGLPLHSFSFYGFLPKKRGERTRLLKSLRLRKETLIFFESPHRIMESLSDMLHIFGSRKTIIGREMTKIYEEKIRGHLQDVLENFRGREQARRKGEYTVIIEGVRNEEAKSENISSYDYFIELVEEAGLDRREAIKLVSKKKGIPKSKVYKEILEKEGRL